LLIRNQSYLVQNLFWEFWKSDFGTEVDLIGVHPKNIYYVLYKEKIIQHFNTKSFLIYQRRTVHSSIVYPASVEFSNNFTGAENYISFGSIKFWVFTLQLLNCLKNYLQQPNIWIVPKWLFIYLLWTIVCNPGIPKTWIPGSRPIFWYRNPGSEPFSIPVLGTSAFLSFWANNFMKNVLGSQVRVNKCQFQCLLKRK
jgi:hypothetical protein